MPRKIKRAGDLEKVREGFGDFLKKAVPVFQKRLLESPWSVVCDVAARARAESSGGNAGFFTVDKGSPVEPQLAAIAKRVAAMSFSPRGVTVFGTHWQAVHPGDTSILRLAASVAIPEKPSAWWRLRSYAYSWWLLLKALVVGRP